MTDAAVTKYPDNPNTNKSKKMILSEARINPNIAENETSKESLNFVNSNITLNTLIIFSIANIVLEVVSIITNLLF